MSAAGDKAGTEAERTDIGTALGALADGLRVRAAAVRGLGAEAGEGRDAHESRVARALAGEIEAAAERLDALGVALCRGCAMRAVREMVVIEGAGNRSTRARSAREE